jgi:hypothetical protein
MQARNLLSVLFFIGLSFSAKAAIHHIEDTIRAEVFLKMIPMKSSRLDQLGVTTMESQMFRENDYIVYQSKDNQTRQKGKIIRFKNGEMWVHNTHSDKIDKVKIEDIGSIRKQYTFWSFASFLLTAMGIYSLLTTAILLLIAIVFIALFNNSGGNSNAGFPNPIFLFFYALLVAVVGAAMSYFGLKNLIPFRKYRIGKYKAKLYEIKPID